MSEEENAILRKECYETMVGLVNGEVGISYFNKVVRNCADKCGISEERLLEELGVEVVTNYGEEITSPGEYDGDQTYYFQGHPIRYDTIKIYMTE